MSDFNLEILDLDLGEGVLRQTYDIWSFDGENEQSFEYFYLTNKNIILATEKTKMFGKSEPVIRKIPLNTIEKVEQVNDKEYGNGLKLYYKNNKADLFELCDVSKKDYQKWVTAIRDAVFNVMDMSSETIVAYRQVFEETVEEKTTNPAEPYNEPKISQEENSVVAGVATVINGFKSAIDVAKQNLTTNIATEAKTKFCPVCGEKQQPDFKFCNNCGSELVHLCHGESNTEQECKKEQSNPHESNIQKCPNCGEVLNSFTVVCPSCGYELRDFSASVQKLYEKLNSVSSIDEKAMLIRNYPVPNTKEDILEFMILASTNVNGNIDKSIFDAWISKIEQTYNKAKIMLQNDSCFQQIEDIYKKTKINIAKGKITQTTNIAGKIAVAFYKAMPNPIFAIVTVALIILNVIHLINGQFAGMNVIFTAVILGVTYKLTEKKQSATKENAPANNKQSNYTVTEVKIPFSVVGGTSENYIKVEQLFLNAGFSNVKTVPLNDLTFGIKNKVGEVDDIIIDGKEISAYIKRKFNSNVPVIITYHSLRK